MHVHTHVQGNLLFPLMQVCKYLTATTTTTTTSANVENAENEIGPTFRTITFSLTSLGHKNTY